MCIGANQPGGPRRCSADAAARCNRTGRAATHAAAYADALSAESVYDTEHLELLELQRKAVMGETLTDAEQAQLRAGAQPPTSAIPDGSEFGRDYAAEYPKHRQDMIDAGFEPSTLAEYASSEDAAEAAYEEWRDDQFEEEMQASYREWTADTASGYYLRRQRSDELDQAREHAATLDVDEARAVLDERAQSPEHQQLLKARDYTHAAEHDAERGWEAAKTSTDIKAVAAARDRLHDAHCDRLIADDDLNAYANESAQYAARVSELSTPPAYSCTTIGDSINIGTHVPGSEAELRSRQDGIPGTHIGAAAGVKDPNSPHTATSAKLSAINAVTDDDINRANHAHTQHTGREGRAAAWEHTTAADFAAANPGLSVQSTPGIWRNSERPWQQTELTAVTSSDGNTPDGALIVKHATANDGYGADIPPHVRAEAANALDATGLKHADIAVNIDGRTYRQYRIHADEPLTGLTQPATMPELREKLDNRWNSWQTEKTNPPQPAHNDGTFTWTKAPRAESGHAKNRATAAELAAYRGISTAQAHEMISAEVASGRSADDAVRSLYKSYNPAADTRRRFVVADIETNSLSAGRGEIIQTGAVVMNGQGKVVERIDELHGIDARTARTIGTGAKDVHRINYQDIHGKPPFAQSQAKTRLQELLSDPNTTMVAHNASFERQYFAANGVSADRVIDTMTLSRRFDHNSTGARLADFTAAHGVEYRDAHNAFKDAHMTARALLGFWRDQHK